MRPAQFVEQLCALSFEHTFNPYSDTCFVHDVVDAPRRRSRALLAVLNAASLVEVDALWIGRDLGYRGGRRTGLAFTDDVHMRAHLVRWGVEGQRPTKGSAVTERTAAVVWGTLSRIHSPIFLWNVFPLHPHEPNEPFTNRSHKAHERAAGEEVLAQLLTLLRPRRIIAIGNEATRTAHRIATEIEVHQVRHPSYGGQTEYSEKIRTLYALEPVAQGKLL
jgi:uracil-DNA glycosylase